MAAKIAASTSDGRRFATAPPRMAPSGTVISHCRRSTVSTAPRAMWARSERIEVGMISASDVPTAICIRVSGATSRVVST